ncbi:TPA: hypothetical protein N0F65_008744 [Lagenidium giganteum]|uniref:A-kinase anchor protein 7-like phosphoesterase domain-containing protein n=1 Tax=Lagenidium giganteum TaxID=4803 RepID=A0AAV2YXY6_9STRA|nr:TPA: hypothetical protein N0F65_008744 [Lagenidium giganteum]
MATLSGGVIGAAGRAARGSWRGRGGGRRGGRSDTNGHGGRGSSAPREAWPSRAKARPNFFVGFRITTEDVIACVEHIQEEIRRRFPELSPCLVDARTLHVTICVLHLADQAAIDQAAEVLQTKGAAIAQVAFDQGVPRFGFQGIGYFGMNDVVYTGLDQDHPHTKSLASFAQSLHHEFRQVGFTTEPFRRPYSPHLTIWKTSKNRNHIARLNDSRCRDENLVQDELRAYLDAHVLTDALSFGAQGLTTMELLSMMEKEPDGYYREYGQLNVEAVLSAELVSPAYVFPWLQRRQRPDRQATDRTGERQRGKPQRHRRLRNHDSIKQQ